MASHAGTARDYALLARGRARGVWSRIGLAAFIGGTTFFLAPSLIVLGWLGAVVAGQGLDRLVFRHMDQHPDQMPSPPYRMAMITVTALNTLIYSGIAVYLWTAGGEIGRMFAIVQVAGGLLHVSLHMHPVREMLIAAVTPHAIYFLGLPLWYGLSHGAAGAVVVFIGGLLYLMHLAIAVRHSKATTDALEEARVEAVCERERAERASAAKSDFLAVISHEIRTPMNAVISAANLLRRTRLSSEQREHVSMLIDAGDVLVGLLNDVLDLSKIEAGKMTFERARMALQPRMSAVVRLWEPRAHAKGLRLKLVLDDSLPEAIITDPLRLQQILFNLMSNAVKFTDEGEVRIEVRLDPSRARLIAAVSDTGCGIAPERLEHIFASFEQAEAGTTRRYGGTGLGLAISRRLAELMGGELSVTSAPGEGSRFTLELPVEVAGADTRAPSAADPAALSLKGRRVLVAEDHEVNRRIIRLLLEPFGADLTLVENGEEAVRAVSASAFDVLVLDMQMPVMDGLSAARTIRAGSSVNALTPIVVLTANAMDTHREAWADVGVHGYLTKPINPEELVRTLHSAGATGDRVEPLTLARDLAHAG